jgi:hypothetical protein
MTVNDECLTAWQDLHRRVVQGDSLSPNEQLEGKLDERTRQLLGIGG